MIKHLQSIFSIIDKLYQKAISGLKKLSEISGLYVK
ncbi:hypothetical protein VO54_02094 [Elizabethkingia miricola]|nr:hypothetical protein VO54_02094 [Elizabethkingia miricola]